METEAHAQTQGSKSVSRRCGWLWQLKVLIPMLAILGLVVAYFPYDAYFQKDDGFQQYIQAQQGFQRVRIRNASLVLVTAYYERRYKRHLVHILGFKKRSDQSLLYCKFIYSEYEIRCSSMPAEARMVDRKQMGDFLAEYFFTCALPPLGKNVPLGVTLTTNTRPCTMARSNIILVHDPLAVGSADPKGIGVCISTPGYDLRNLDHAQKIVETVVLNKAMGADYVEFHNESMSPDLEPVLKKFIDEGTLRIVKWNARTKSVKNYAQALAMNDCLYRNMYRFKYLVFTDLDELLVPARITRPNVTDSTKSRWQHLFEYLERKENSTLPVVRFLFPTTGFYEDKELRFTDTRFSKYLICPSETPGLNSATLPMVISHRKRDKEPDAEDTISRRFVVNPRAVGSVTVNDVSHLFTGVASVTAKRREATVRHFRSPDFPLDDFDLEEDSSLDGFLPRLVKALQETVEFPRECKIKPRLPIPLKLPSRFNRTRYRYKSNFNRTFIRRFGSYSKFNKSSRFGFKNEAGQPFQSGQNQQFNKPLPSGQGTQVNQGGQSGQNTQFNQPLQEGSKTQDTQAPPEGQNPQFKDGQNIQVKQTIQDRKNTQFDQPLGDGQNIQVNQPVRSEQNSEVNQPPRDEQNTQINQPPPWHW